MKRVLGLTVLVLGFALPAAADLTLKQSGTGKGMGMGGSMSTITYIKGAKMRTDSIVGNKTTSMVFDLDAQKLYMFESGKKEADVYDMGAFGAEISKNVDTSGMKVSLKPNGQTKEIAGQKAAGYDMEVTVPATMGGNKDMTMVITLSGPQWIVKGGPGSEDYIKFYKAAVEKGWIFSNPQQAKASPGQAKAMAEMYRQLAEAGGIAYESETNIKMGGGGAGNPLGGFMAKLGNISMTMKVDSVDTAALADDLFAPPAGSKLNQKK